MKSIISSIWSLPTLETIGMDRALSKEYDISWPLISLIRLLDLSILLTPGDFLDSATLAFPSRPLPAISMAA